MTGIPAELQALEMCFFKGYITKWGRRAVEIMGYYKPGRGGERGTMRCRRYRHAAQDLAEVMDIQEELATRLANFQH